MPLPTPSAGQSHDRWISSCMANPTMRHEYPDQHQRYAICESQWARTRGAVSMNEIQRKQFPTVIRAMGDRMVSAIISMETPDRDGDMIACDGWQLANYQRNPVIMWGHDYSEPPIARATSIEVVGGSLRAGIEFPPPGLSQRADEICGLVKAGFVNATSVGFRPMPGCAKPNQAGGLDYSAQELLEFSFVPIGAHPQALVTQRSAMTRWLKGDPYSDGRPTSQRPIGARPTECPAGDNCANPNQQENCPAARVCPIAGHARASITPAELRASDRALARLAAEVRDDSVIHGIPDDLLGDAIAIGIQLAMPEMIADSVRYSGKVV